MRAAKFDVPPPPPPHTLLPFRTVNRRQDYLAFSGSAWIFSAETVPIFGPWPWMFFMRTNSEHQLLRFQLQLVARHAVRVSETSSSYSSWMSPFTNLINNCIPAARCVIEKRACLRSLSSMGYMAWTPRLPHKYCCIQY